MNNDFLTEQIVNISKAGAFDALSKVHADIEERYKNVRADLNKILDEVVNEGPKIIVNNPAEFIERIARICLDSLKNNRP